MKLIVAVMSLLTVLGIILLNEIFPSSGPAFDSFCANVVANPDYTIFWSRLIVLFLAGYLFTPILSKIVGISVKWGMIINTAWLLFSAYMYLAPQIDCGLV